jgi:hypothetical protein
MNQLLADGLGLITDARRMAALFEAAQPMAQAIPGLHLALQSGGAITARTALPYKYSPTMRYILTLLGDDAGVVGEIRAALRSQNRELVFHLRRFFVLWSKIEGAYGQNPDYALDGSRFVRRFRLPARLLRDAPGQAALLLGYVTAMDRAFRGYFAQAGDQVAAVKAIEGAYLDYLKAQQL